MNAKRGTWLLLVAAAAATALTTGNARARQVVSRDSCATPSLEPSITSFRNTASWRDQHGTLFFRFHIEFDLKQYSYGIMQIYGFGGSINLYPRNPPPQQAVDFTISPIPGYGGGQYQEYVLFNTSYLGPCTATEAETPVYLPGQAPFGQTLTLAAAGDSYSTAEGTQPGRVHDKGCHQGDEAWPALMAKSLPQLVQVADVACSGAHIADLFRGFKGQTPQIQVLKAAQPGYLTLTIGGNDAGFSKALYNCVRYNCSRGKLLQNGAAIASLRSQLYGAFISLERALPRTVIVIPLYPRIFPANGQPIVGCPWLKGPERADLNQLGDDLNAQISAAANQVNSVMGVGGDIHVVSTWNAFAGHELCSGNSWVFPISLTCVIDSRCGHPTLPGQQAMAAIVSRFVGGLLAKYQP